MIIDTNTISINLLARRKDGVSNDQSARHLQPKWTRGDGSANAGPQKEEFLVAFFLSSHRGWGPDFCWSLFLSTVVATWLATLPMDMRFSLGRAVRGGAVARAPRVRTTTAEVACRLDFPLLPLGLRRRTGVGRTDRSRPVAHRLVAVASTAVFLRFTRFASCCFNQEHSRCSS